VAGRSIALAFSVGLLPVPLSCGGKSLVTEDGGGTSSGGVSFGGAMSGGVSAGGATSGAGGSVIPRGGSTATGGRAGTSTGGTAGAPNGCEPSGIAGGTNGFTLMPDCNGWIDGFSNMLGVQGGWYPFGDAYSGPNDEKCLTVGQHRQAECSLVATPPPPPALGFPQAVRGQMCTSGEVAVILPCAPALMTSGCPERDYANMTGAGIAVDFNADRNEDGGAKHPWDPSVAGIIGFSFEIDSVSLMTLRVEIPMVLTDAEASAVALPLGSTTDQHPDGSPYWGASMTYPASPVMARVNRVLWSDIHPPRTNYVFEPRRMLGIQFHVPAIAVQPRGAYGFCISNLTLLRQ
jgi:hypothetical protein